MGAYKYICQHEDCDKLDEGIRKCKDCDMVIITNRGVEKPNMLINTEWEESS